MNHAFPALPLASARPLYHPLPPRAARPPAPQDIHALYFHVPFCSTKCHYCDFYSVAGHLDQSDAFLLALQREMELQIAHFTRPRPSTIFVGGGTPTLLSPTHLQTFLTIIRSTTDLSALQEFTVEANPNTFDAEKAKILAAAGVNRISFGAQSFHPAELATLQRDHDPANVPTAVALARSAGITNLNLDLIFGIPGQTLASWNSSLQQALALQPTHLSCYSLIYEPNTAMTARLNRHEFAPIDEELELQMFEHVYTTLRTAGFERYETSNYALPGHRCQHNMHYWTGANYLAFGPSASAHLNGHRWKNVASINRYLDALLPDPPSRPTLPIIEHEHLPAHKRAGELATLLLRLADGMNLADFAQKTSIPPLPRLQNVLKKYANLNLLDLTPTHLKLTENAVRVSNTILADVLAAFD